MGGHWWPCQRKRRGRSRAEGFGTPCSRCVGDDRPPQLRGPSPLFCRAASSRAAVAKKKRPAFAGQDALQGKQTLCDSRVGVDPHQQLSSWRSATAGVAKYRLARRAVDVDLAIDHGRCGRRYEPARAVPGDAREFGQSNRATTLLVDQLAYRHPTRRTRSYSSSAQRSMRA
jgi:hypothetical protein